MKFTWGIDTNVGRDGTSIHQLVKSGPTSTSTLKNADVSLRYHTNTSSNRFRNSHSSNRQPTNSTSTTQSRNSSGLTPHPTSQHRKQKSHLTDTTDLPSRTVNTSGLRQPLDHHTHLQH